MEKQRYLDNAATTKIRAEAMAEYVRVSEEIWGNPSSLHSLGNDAERVISNAKQTILYTLGAKDAEVLAESVEAIKNESKSMHELVEKLLFLSKKSNFSL